MSRSGAISRTDGQIARTHFKSATFWRVLRGSTVALFPFFNLCFFLCHLPLVVSVCAQLRGAQTAVLSQLCLRVVR
jgi:hypothetical protein